MSLVGRIEIQGTRWADLPSSSPSIDRSTVVLFDLTVYKTQNFHEISVSAGPQAAAGHALLRRSIPLAMLG
jgi:hypothetical protein